MTRRKKPDTDPKKAIAYLRCSTHRLDLSPDARRDAIRGEAARAGIEVVAWHEDSGVSGGAAIDKRPGLLAALDAVKAEGAGLLGVAKRDRLARDVLVAAMVERPFKRAGARLESACGVGNGTGPEAQLLRPIVDAFAQCERALIGPERRLRWRPNGPAESGSAGCPTAAAMREACRSRTRTSRPSSPGRGSCAPRGCRCGGSGGRCLTRGTSRVRASGDMYRCWGGPLM